MIDFHPYNNKTLVYSSKHSTDTDISVIEAVLNTKLKSEWKPINYHISFFSGGIGVVDKITIQIEMSLPDFFQFVLEKKYVSLLDLYQKEAIDEFIWLFDIEDNKPNFIQILNGMQSYLQDEFKEMPININDTDTKNVFVDSESTTNQFTIIIYQSGRMYFWEYIQG